MSLVIQKGGRGIATLDDWLRFAPPKMGMRQWKDGRSAKELARAFVASGIPATPPQLQELLSSNADLGAIELTEAFPEHEIPLDLYRGEPRNADLAAIGAGKSGPVAVTIEAKADEPFGETIGSTLDSAPENSNIPKRISALAQAMFGRAAGRLPNLRYQLLHAAAASLIFAKHRKATAAIFAVLEFGGPACVPEKLARNAADFDAFMQALVPSLPPPTTGVLLGPFLVPGGEFVPKGLPLYVGKARM